MAHPILMPKAGQTMTEGRLIVWIKKEGDSVERGEPLLEIETDKANLEVESTESGVLRKIFAAEGEVCLVLSVVGILGDAEEDIDFDALREAGNRAAAEAAEESEPAVPPKPSELSVSFVPLPPVSSAKVEASSLARSERGLASCSICRTESWPPISVPEYGRTAN